MTPLLAQLYALRAQLDAVILGLEQSETPQTVEPGSCPKCGAAPDRVQDISTLDGTKRSRCQECGHEWER